MIKSSNLKHCAARYLERLEEKGFTEKIKLINGKNPLSFRFEIRWLDTTPLKKGSKFNNYIKALILIDGVWAANHMPYGGIGADSKHTVLAINMMPRM